MKLKRIRFVSASLALAAFPCSALLPVSAAQAGPLIAVSTEAPSTQSVYGLLSRLPKDTEGFASMYRLSELWDGFRKSNFVKKVLSNEELVRELDLDKAMREWENNPQLQEYGTMAASLIGGEITIALPAGFTDSLAELLKQLPAVQAGFLTARAAQPGQNGGGMPKEMLPIIEAATRLNLPPVVVAMKAGKHKETLKALIGQALNQIPAEVMTKLSKTTSDVNGNAFEHLGMKLVNVVPEDVQRDMKSDLTKAAGSAEKGEAIAKQLLAKTAELSWGWVDDYLVLSIGPDHSHLKFVSPAESVLTHPDVVARAAQFAPKKPISLSYTSQKAIRTMNELGGVFKSLISLAGMAKGADVPFSLDNIVAELKKLDAKAGEVFPNDADANVAAMWWDGGLQIESYGGPKPRAYDNSKPLTLSGLATDSTFLMANGRGNGPFRDKVFGFIEELALTTYDVYQREVKNHLPPDVKSGSAMAEMIGVPMVKELWTSLQNFRAAMGDEGSLFLDLNGEIPNIPQANIPPEIVAKGKAPRLAYVNELKDRAKLAESWNGLKTIITSAATMAAAQSGVTVKTEPVKKQAGSVEIYGYELPLDTGDLWPHTGVTPTHWYISTSPSFTKELSSKAPATTGPACGSHWQVNFPALWNFGAAWAKLIPASEKETEMVDFALSLARAIGSLDVRLGEEGGQSRDTMSLVIKDIQ